MNDNRFSFRKLSMALGGLILLIGIPVFFWLAQMSIGAANNPDAGLNPGEGLDPARPTPTVAAIVREVPIVTPSRDNVLLARMPDIPQGATVGRYETIFLTIGYELVTVEEAELIVKLVNGQRGVLTVIEMVSGDSGYVDIALPLAQLEDVTGESVVLDLNLILRDPAAPAEEVLYLDFVEGWTVDLTAEAPATTAELIHISKPTPVESEGAAANSTYEVELTTAYTLAGYEEAVLVVGYEFTDENGSGGGYEVNAIGAGSDTIAVTMQLDGSFLNDQGELVEGARFFARINHYDEASAQWVNLYPGNEPLLESELALPYPYQQDVFFIESVAWGEDESGNPLLKVTLNYSLFSQPTALASVKATVGEGDVLFAGETFALVNREGPLTILLRFHPPLIADETLVRVSAVLTAGETEIQDDRAILIEGAALQPPAEGDNQVWIVSANVVTHTTENGVAADITLIVGHNLSNDYSGGHIAFSNQYQASAQGGGSGGGGGSEGVVIPGNGVTEFAFGFETTSWAIAQDWLNNIVVTLQLFGITADGSEVLLAELSQIGVDKEP